MAAKLIATEVPEPKLKKGNVIKFPKITTPMPKKDGPIRKRLYGSARTINKIEIDEMEVEDLKTMVFFGWELVSFGRIDVAKEEKYFSILKERYFVELKQWFERLKEIAEKIASG